MARMEDDSFGGDVSPDLAGKYSLAKMSRHVYAHGEQIGASEGEMTCKVRIEASNRDVHVYPVPEATPVG